MKFFLDNFSQRVYYRREEALMQGDVIGRGKVWGCFGYPVYNEVGGFFEMNARDTY